MAENFHEGTSEIEIEPNYLLLPNIDANQRNTWKKLELPREVQWPAAIIQ